MAIANQLYRMKDHHHPVTKPFLFKDSTWLMFQMKSYNFQGLGRKERKF